MSALVPDWFAALDATWPAARRWQSGIWTLREGRGGGQRVSAATTDAAADARAITDAEAEMRRIGQAPLFRLGETEAEIALNADLDRREYVLCDRTVILAGPAAGVAGEAMPPLSGFPVWPPLAIQRRIWLDGGIGPGRLDVMARAAEPRVTLLGRHDDRVAGTAFVACAGQIAMLHALEVPAAMRRMGVGRLIMRHAAHWAVERGANLVSVAVTQVNEPALLLYASLGMVEVARYHYRRSAG